MLLIFCCPNNLYYYIISYLLVFSNRFIVVEICFRELKKKEYKTIISYELLVIYYEDKKT